MKQHCGFSLIELLLGLSISSVLIIVLGKLHSSFNLRQSIVKEHRFLLPYLDEFEHFLAQKNERERCGNWFCYQDKETKERIFHKDCPIGCWKYKIHVKQAKENLYEADFFGKTKHLCKICYYL